MCPLWGEFQQDVLGGGRGFRWWWGGGVGKQARTSKTGPNGKQMINVK